MQSLKTQKLSLSPLRTGGGGRGALFLGPGKNIMHARPRSVFSPTPLSVSRRLWPSSIHTHKHTHTPTPSRRAASPLSDHAREPRFVFSLGLSPLAACAEGSRAQAHTLPTPTPNPHPIMAALFSFKKRRAAAAFGRPPLHVNTPGGTHFCIPRRLIRCRAAHTHTHTHTHTRTRICTRDLKHTFVFPHSTRRAARTHEGTRTHDQKYPHT